MDVEVLQLDNNNPIPSVVPQSWNLPIYIMEKIKDSTLSSPPPEWRPYKSKHVRPTPIFRSPPSLSLLAVGRNLPLFLIYFFILLCLSHLLLCCNLTSSRYSSTPSTCRSSNSPSPLSLSSPKNSVYSLIWHKNKRHNHMALFFCNHKSRWSKIKEFLERRARS